MKLSFYNINHVESLEDNQKIILPIELSDKKALDLIHKPFFYNYDDSRKLYCSYFVDYRYNKNEFIKNKQLVEYFLEKQINIDKLMSSFLLKNTELETEFNKGIQSLNIIGTYILSSNNKTYNFLQFIIEYQLEQYRDSITKNPIVFLPYLTKEHEEAIISFCKNKLLHLVVFDFINFDIQTEKKIFNTNFDIIKKNLDYSSQLTLDTIKAVCLIQDITSIATNYKGELFVVQNYDNLCQKMKDYGHCSFFYTMITDHKVYNKFIKLFKDHNSKIEITRSLIHFKKSLDFINYPFGYDEMVIFYNDFVNVVPKTGQHKVGIKKLNSNFQKWTFKEKIAFINLMMINGIIDEDMELPILDIESSRGLLNKVENFNHLCNMIQKEYPLVYIKLIEDILKNEQFIGLFNDIQEHGSLEIFKALETHVKLHAIDAKKIANNRFFLDIYDHYAEKISNINQVIDILPEYTLMCFIKKKYKDKNIASFFSDEIATRSIHLLNDILMQSMDSKIYLNKAILKLLMLHNYKTLLGVIQKSGRIAVSTQTQKTMQLQCFKNSFYPEARVIYEMVTSKMILNN